jgi:hypothetical protein
MFYVNNPWAMSRFCFCKRDETLDLAAERLRKLRVMV